MPDAIQRAEFFKSAKADWHTELAAEQTSSLVVQIPYGDYFYGLNKDGTCCAFILVDANAFENAFFNTIVEAINAGTITTQDISTFLFPNTYLYEALAQWFDTGQPSDALDGAFSYPNESVLTSPATFQNVNCS